MLMCANRKKSIDCGERRRSREEIIGRSETRLGQAYLNAKPVRLARLNGSLV